jgi:hypothetical protein
MRWSSYIHRFLGHAAAEKIPGEIAWYKVNNWDTKNEAMEESEGRRGRTILFGDRHKSVILGS